METSKTNCNYIQEQRNVNNNDESHINRSNPPIRENKNRRRKLRKTQQKEGNYFCINCKKRFSNYSYYFAHFSNNHSRVSANTEEKERNIPLPHDVITNSSLLSPNIFSTVKLREAFYFSESKILYFLEKEVENIFLGYEAENESLIYSQFIIAKHHPFYMSFEVILMAATKLNTENEYYDRVLAIFLALNSAKLKTEKEVKKLFNFMILVREKINIYYKNMAKFYEKIGFTEMNNINCSTLEFELKDFHYEYSSLLKYSTIETVLKINELIQWMKERNK